MSQTSRAAALVAVVLLVATAVVMASIIHKVLTSDPPRQATIRQYSI